MAKLIKTVKFEKGDDGVKKFEWPELEIAQLFDESVMGPILSTIICEEDEGHCGDDV